MALTARDIANHPALHGVMRRQAGLLLQVRESNPRMASIFASQQRWLMAQAALALHFRTVATGCSLGITSASFLDLVARHGVASRNTADAFLKEIVQYGYAHYVPDKADRRRRPLMPAAAALDALHAWCVIHLATLDALVPGRRVEAFVADPGGLTQFQPLIADGLLASHGVRQPETTFSLFTWLDNGGWVMDRLMAAMEDGSPDAERIVTIEVSISAMAQWLGLSRTHLSRKFAEAEAMGSIGWLGKRGDSVMWVSAGFRRQYAAAQAAKLAVIDEAFEACFSESVLARAQEPAQRSGSSAWPWTTALP
jgi:AraC-like DNA-binding protein